MSETKLYELINPSDPYTLEASDLRAAASACIYLGNGMYSLEAADGTSTGVPMFFGNRAGEDLDAWWTKTFGEGNFVDWAGANAEAVAQVLDSVLIGKHGDRILFKLALSLIDDEEKRATWRATWHDNKRSSLNDIGARARALAGALRAKQEAGYA